MLERLLGIKTLEETEPVELIEVDPSMAPTLPADYEEHLDDHNEDFFRLDPYTNLDLDGVEVEVPVEDDDFDDA